ncbi:MAG TPA: LLM class flavin-dependent oxidoreductase [Steroidobacteraceae bacterium]|nr:LLM class flavin-dependent oxidoreductase [Steroidobacteraceae bacterium]
MQLLPMPQAIEAMAQAMAALSDGQGTVPARIICPLPAGRGFLGVMPGVAGAPAAVGAKLGTILPDNPAVGRPAIQAVLAEQAGADSVWFPHDTFMRNTLALTSAAAAMTQRVQLGGVAISSYTTDPCELATYAATLDEISGGRCILGVGMHTRLMTEWTGRDTGEYLQHTRESVRLIRELLRGEVARGDGRLFRWTGECYLRFRPPRAEIPIYVSSFGRALRELSGEVGDGAQPMLTPPAAARQVVEDTERGFDRTRRPRATFTISGCAWLSLSAERAAAADRMRNMVAYFGPYLEDEALAHVGLTSADFDPIRERLRAADHKGARSLVTEDMLRLGLIGTPREVIRQIEELAAAGIDEVGLGGPLGPDPQAALQLLGREVIPYFRS